MDTTLYEEWLLAQGLEDSTIVNYRGKVVTAHAIAGEQGWDLRHVTASQVRWISTSWPQTGSTLGQLKAALSHYWQMEEVPDLSQAIRLPKRTGVDYYKGLEDDEAGRLEATAVSRGGLVGLVVLVGLYLGLRRGEMARLRWGDFDQDLEWVDVLGKGSRRRWLPVHNELRPHLTPDDGWVFPGRYDNHIHTGTIYNWVEALGCEAGVPEERRNPHALRHTCLTRLYEQTGDIRMVQEFAGHSDPNTTARYTRVPRRRLSAGVQSIRYRRCVACVGECGGCRAA